MKGMRRPKATVLPRDALIADRNVVEPAPNRFTHELTRAAPYYYDEARRGDSPDGELPAGTKVVLLRQDGVRCRVVDGRGLYVEIACEALRPL